MIMVLWDLPILNQSLWIRIRVRVTLRTCHFLRNNFKLYPFPYQVHCLNPLTLPVMFQSQIPISQTLPVMLLMQQMDTLWEALTHHHVLDTTNACHQEFIEPYPNYFCITLLAPKNCLPLEGPCLHMKEGERWCRKKRELFPLFQIV